jgi:hypothetical protein
MSLLNFLQNINKEIKNNENNQKMKNDATKEKEMNDLELYDYEKEVVKSNDAEPIDFDEDDASNDDDYYHEDE